MQLGKFTNALMAAAMAVTVTGLKLHAQTESERRLAASLARDDARPEAIADILASRAVNEPLLLSWSRNPPSGIDEHGLFIGLADAFGQLKTRQAIPFLIVNLTRRRTRHADFAPWLKTDETIIQTFPAIAALIQIGPEASRALIRQYGEPMVPEARLAALFIVARIREVPEARAFLISALAQANQERHQAEGGIKALDQPR